MSKSQHKLNNKQDVFSYDALQDKFASYYFSGYGVKKHLKKLRKIIQLQPRQKGLREYEEKLDQKLADLEKQEPNNNQVQPYQQTLKLSSLQKFKNFQNSFNAQKCKTLKADELKVNKKQGNSLSNFPSISKTISPKIQGERISELEKSLQIKQEKTFSIKKSMSYADKANVVITKNPQKVNRDRINKSLETKKIEFQSKQNVGIGNIKELKHEQFISFLKMHRESAENIKKTIRQQKVKKQIREQILQYSND